MGFFDEQIRRRESNDNESFDGAFTELASVVMGEKVIFARATEKNRIRNALDEILSYYREKEMEYPDNMDNFDELLEYFTRSSGLMKRTVYLTDQWYEQAIGPFLAFTQSGGIAALMPDGRKGYSYIDYQTGKKKRITRQNAGDFKKTAFCFYRPFPERKITRKDLLQYMRQSLDGRDIRTLLFTLAVTAICLFVSLLTNITLVSQTLTSANSDISYVYIVAVLFCATITIILLKAVENYLLNRIKTRVSSGVQAAIMMRILSLPTAFFRGTSAGELAERAQYASGFCDAAADTFLSAVPQFLMTFLFIIYGFMRTPQMSWLLAGEMLLLLAVSWLCYSNNKRHIIRRLQASSASGGVNYAIISGIQKIRLAGAEKRAFAKWSKNYKKTAKAVYDPPFIAKITNILPNLIILFFMLLYFKTAAASGLYLEGYYGFDLVYEAVNAAFLVLYREIMRFAQSAASFEIARDIFETEPETSGSQKPVSKLRGKIEVSHLSFRYDPGQPFLYQNLSLQINPGEYVAIVGRSGCGKSSLIRLLLGFEKPEKGAIYYDGVDMKKLDLKSLRRRIGTVLQNGKLFVGDIYYNIIISAPWLTMEDAWEAAEIAGIAEDIRRMPMQMRTLLSEDQGGLSGGQRQRLIIARAVASKPKILIMDEATSALDNLTQKKVTDALSGLKCTRIIIAHRLSTVKNCDRILVLDQGKIAEDGTYEELIRKNGIFAELVSRQQLSDGSQNQTQAVGF